ncbi:MAG: hypothetical protein M3179_07620 [Actinomycetota bacterium]|nr:hypothetical protein [Actinomycetota bacterium]
MADRELLEQVGRALRPGPVQPPADRVKRLRALVTSSPKAGTNGARAGGEIDGDLIDDVARALRPGAIEPPAHRVEGLRRMIGTPAASTDDAESKPPEGVVDLHAARARKPQPAKLSRMVSGLFAAAAVAIVVAMVAVNQLPGALRDVAHTVGLPVASPEQAQAERDVDRLELALARRNADEVAQADAAMLRSTSKLSGDELRKLRDRAVRLHVEAIAFLRDNPTPNALSGLPSPDAPAPGTAVGPDQAAPAPPGPAGPAPAGPPEPSAGSTRQPSTVATTVPPQAPTVRIVAVSPRLNASFQVDFEVSGFTLGPGQPYTVHFYFDDGQEIASYSGPSPWTFPVLNAVKYRTVCAQVADAAGVRDPKSGDCKPILLI